METTENPILISIAHLLFAAIYLHFVLGWWGLDIAMEVFFVSMVAACIAEHETKHARETGGAYEQQLTIGTGICLVVVYLIALPYHFGVAIAYGILCAIWHVIWQVITAFFYNVYFDLNLSNSPRIQELGDWVYDHIGHHYQGAPMKKIDGLTLARRLTAIERNEPFEISLFYDDGSSYRERYYSWGGMFVYVVDERGIAKGWTQDYTIEDEEERIARYNATGIFPQLIPITLKGVHIAQLPLFREA